MLSSIPQARLTDPGTAYYLCRSRLLGGAFLLKEEEKAFFSKTLRGLEAFTGVRVLTFCVMSNHFHLLLQVPDEDELENESDLSDAMLVKLLRPLYGKEKSQQLKAELANCDQNHFKEKKALLRKSLLSRRGRLDFFMKDLKQRVTGIDARRVVF